MKTIFITGGGGYIGSHVAEYFLKQKMQVAVFDNFSTGFRQPLEILRSRFGGLKIYKGDLRRPAQILAALKAVRPDAVLHLAARCSVDESMKNPGLYLDNNVFGTANLLSAMQKIGIKKIIFSSTCAVYGEVAKLPIKESDPPKPVNFYGQSKVLAEELIKWHAKANGLSYVIFRFFNVCGADSDGLIGDSKKPSVLLVQNAVRGALGIEPFYLTCPKVNTKDGSPIRDYIDVEDLARAHLLAYGHLSRSGKNLTLNLGNGAGYSVLQIINTVGQVLGKKIKVKKAKAREGEYAKIYASNFLAKKSLGFEPKKSLAQSILSLKKWYEKYPNGYSR